MNFQNISIPGSIVMLCTTKRDKQTNVINERMDERTDKPEAICPLTFFKVGGIFSLQKSCLKFSTFFLIQMYGAYTKA